MPHLDRKRVENAIKEINGLIDDHVSEMEKPYLISFVTYLRKDELNAIILLKDLVESILMEKKNGEKKW